MLTALEARAARATRTGRASTLFQHPSSSATVFESHYSIKFFTARFHDDRSVAGVNEKEMFGAPTTVSYALLVPLAALITYYDSLYRRIPNAFVLATLAGGLAMNTIYSGAAGAWASAGGCALAFVLMFVLHVFGAMGAGDVKLFAAI